MVAEHYFGFRVGGTLYIKFHGHQWHLSSANCLPLSQVFVDLLILANLMDVQNFNCQPYANKLHPRIVSVHEALPQLPP